MKKTVLILGGRGRFGWAATQAFAQQGWHVICQVRPGTKQQSDSRITWLAADIADTATLARIAHGASIVINALNPRYTNRIWQEQAPRMMSAAIEVALKLDALLMFPGNVYNFGANMPPILYEDTPQTATTIKGSVRTALERQLADAATRGLQSAVIRAGDFFGAGRGTWFDMMVAKDLPRGKFAYAGALDIPTAWAYLPDLADSFVRVAEKRDTLGRFEAFNFAGYSLTGQEWLDALTLTARELGWIGTDHGLKTATMPWGLIRLVGLVNPVWAALTEMRYLWSTPHALDGSRLAQLIGPEPHTPFADAARSAAIQLHGATHSLQAHPAH